MARMMFFVITAVAIVMLFGLAGIGIAGEFIDNLFKLSSGAMTASDFFSFLFNTGSGRLFLASAVASIIASFFARVQVENFIMLGIIVGVFLALCGVFTNVVMTSQNCVVVSINPPVSDCTPWEAEWGWLAGTIKIFFTLFLLGYIITMIEFFRGNV